MVGGDQRDQQDGEGQDDGDWASPYSPTQRPPYTPNAEREEGREGGAMSEALITCRDGTWHLGKKLDSPFIHVARVDGEERGDSAEQPQCQPDDDEPEHSRQLLGGTQHPADP